MTARLLAMLVGAFILLGTSLRADESSVQADPTADFSRLRTFSLRTQRVDSRREELDNPLFLKKLANAIRGALIAKGLTENSTAPDVRVDFTVTGEEFGDTQRSLVRGIRGGPVVIRRPLRIAEGTLVIDIVRRDETDPIWRGVYRDDERTGSKLVFKLLDDAKRLVGKYPKLTR